MKEYIGEYSGYKTEEPACLLEGKIAELANLCDADFVKLTKYRVTKMIEGTLKLKHIESKRMFLVEVSYEAVDEEEMEIDFEIYEIFE